jgi:hypothetical protein
VEPRRRKDEQRGSCGAKRITSFFLFVLLSVFVTLSQSKSSRNRNKAAQYNVTFGQKNWKKKRNKDKKSQPEMKQKALGGEGV